MIRLVIPHIHPVFLAIPVVLALAVPLVDADLHARVLRFGGDGCHECRKSSHQE